MEENNTGLYDKYRIEKADGSPVDPDGVYFVLRLDGDSDYASASRLALATYSCSIGTTNRKLADDLFNLVMVLWSKANSNQSAGAASAGGSR